jgi:UV DNA damage repair endonuclease
MNRQTSVQNYFLIFGEAENMQICQKRQIVFFHHHNICSYELRMQESKKLVLFIANAQQTVPRYVFITP